ncbi:MAG: homoserine dehydrogenase [Anaerolineae bacterium]|nr:homoserine dehydrogenase [Anaerolineae bacterium]
MMKIALIGFGVVGQGLTEILRNKSKELVQAGFRGELVAVATRSRGSLYHPDGLDPELLLAAIQRGHLDYYPDVYGLYRNWDTLTLIKQCNADVLVETSNTNLETAQPALDYCYAAIEHHMHVVLANKGPVAVAYAELQRRAKAAAVKLRFEATVMAGTPSIRLAMQALKGCEIREAQGILNGTTNFILTQMEGGLGYEEALAQAQALGYAEADPTADVDGWDAAGKVMILARALFNSTITLKDMEVQGISQISAADVKAAQEAGEKWKLIARVTPTSGSVHPVRVPLSNPLAAVSGAMNAITYNTDLLGDVTLVGAGAGRLQTGFGLLSDLLDIAGVGALS